LARVESLIDSCCFLPRRASEHTRRNALLVICIILFPIGLLALLARPTETITVTSTEVDGTVRANATGTGDQKVIEAVKIVLEGDY
jgi:hypothetical protein